MDTAVDTTQAPSAPIDLPEELSLEDAGALIEAGVVDQTFEITDETGDTSVIKKSTQQGRLPERPAEQESEPEGEDEDRPKKATTSKDEATEQDDAPAIEMPSSWKKDAQDRWSKLDPETQKYLLEADKRDQANLKRAFNEAADQRKSVEAERGKIEQAKTDYETKLRGVVEQLTDINNSQFSEIKSQADLDKLVTAMNQLTAQGNVNDAMQIQAYLQAWQNHQQKLQSRTAELRQIENDRATENATQWGKFTSDEDNKFSESLSDGDRTKLDDRMKAAPEFLEDRGFSKQELFDLWNGKSKISLRDHRIQALVHDGLKLREIMSAPLKAVPKSVPQVQRPGVQRAPSEVQDETIQQLQRKLDQTGSEEDGWALLQAQMRRGARAS